MIVDRINAYLSEPKSIPYHILEETAKMSMFAFDRQFGLDARKLEGDERTLRLSAIGQCLRKQAYNVLGFPINGKEIDPRAKMVFFQGDMVEMAIVQLAKLAGCKITHSGLEQQEVDINGVKGHPDGILETDLENYLVEVKSMSSYSFADFEDGQIDESYIYQMNAYLMALGLDKCVYIALNKDSGVMAERMMTSNADIQKQIIANIKTLNAITKESLPDRKFSANDKGIWPWNCAYCCHHYTCIPNAEIKLIGRSNKLINKIEVTP